MGKCVSRILQCALKIFAEVVVSPREVCSLNGSGGFVWKLFEAPLLSSLRLCGRGY